MAEFRELSNGFLVAPQRGDPPEPPEGYERLTGEQYVFAPILPSCEYREKRLIRRGCCGGTSERFYCHKTNTFVSRYFCVGCMEDAK